MGCNSSKSAEEAENIKPENTEKTKENQETIEPKTEDKKDDKKEKKSEEESKNKKKEKNNNFLKLNDKTKIADKEMQRINTDENKDALSNVLTEGVMTTDGGRLAMQKHHFNGVTVMKEIEECFSEDINQDEILALVEDALGDNIVEDENQKYPGTITSKQARAVANILYNKLNKNKNEEDDKNGEIDLKNYKELKGVNIKIGVTNLTREVIKKYIYNGQNVDDYQIDLTYNNLTKDNNNFFKALSIQIDP